MPPGFIALIFWILAGCAIWGMVWSLRTGIAISTFTYRRDQNPVAFLMVLVGQVLVVVLAIAETLHAVGLIGDPLVALGSIMPFRR